MMPVQRDLLEANSLMCCECCVLFLVGITNQVIGGMVSVRAFGAHAAGSNPNLAVQFLTGDYMWLQSM